MNIAEYELRVTPEWTTPIRCGRYLTEVLTRADLAIDLGTANTLFYRRGKGIVLNQPSLIAFNANNSLPLAVGEAARGLHCVRPLKSGVVADVAATSSMIKAMIHQVISRWSPLRPRVVVGIPSSTTLTDKRLLLDSFWQAGIPKVALVEEATAAVLGSQYAEQNTPLMLVDIGGGTTNLVILKGQETLYSRAIPVAGDTMDAAIMKALKSEYRCEISRCEAEKLKILLGSALKRTRSHHAACYGKSVFEGTPVELKISSGFIEEAIEPTIIAIRSLIIQALDECDTQTSNLLIAKGIHLAGGGSLLRGLASRFKRETAIPFSTVHDPLSCVVKGAGKIVDHYSRYKSYCASQW